MIFFTILDINLFAIGTNKNSRVILFIVWLYIFWGMLHTRGDKMRHVKVSVKGQVQGVGFRYFTQHAATENAIVGWVRNEDDGRVLIEAQGKDKNIDFFLKEVEQGPTKFASVQDMEVTELEEDAGLTKFEVKY